MRHDPAALRDPEVGPGPSRAEPRRPATGPALTTSPVPPAGLTPAPPPGLVAPTPASSPERRNLAPLIIICVSAGIALGILVSLLL